MPRCRTSFVGLVVAAAALCGCGGGEVAARLLPMTNDVARGPQGGMHVLLELTCEGCPGEVELEYGLETPTGDLVTFPAHRALTLPVDGDQATYGPLLAIFDSSGPEPHAKLVIWGDLVTSEGTLSLAAEMAPAWPAE